MREAFVLSLILAFAHFVFGQFVTTNYSDPITGISGGYVKAGGFSMLLAIPSDIASYPDEFIVQLAGSRSGNTAGGWSGISIGGNMVTGLLLLANLPANGTAVSAIFSVTSTYSRANLYTGPAVATKLAETINATHYQVVFRCQKCTSWSQDGVSGSLDFASNSGSWGYGLSSRPISAGGSITQHNLGYGMFSVNYRDIRALGTDYSKWIETSPTSTKTLTSPTSSSSPTTSGQVAPSASTLPVTKTTQSPTPAITESFDYIIVGSGIGGQVAADRLSESGRYSVLLIERGPPSTYANGGRDGSAWTQNNNLTRFDVPGLWNEIWSNSSIYSCDDYPSIGGCLLGGGTAINAGIFWKPSKEDFDNVFPDGWKSKDVKESIRKVFEKIPSTTNPANDGERYFLKDHKLFAPVLNDNGWKFVDANATPDLKNRTYAFPPLMFINGERGGPLATYTLSARKRQNFKIIFNTMVERVTRSGKIVTGVDVIAAGTGGVTGNLKLNPRGRVILSAGAFGSPKILWRSGIGSSDMLSIVSESSDASKLLPKDQWINLPVGYNLIDHTATIVGLDHPNLTSYGEIYDSLWDNPPEAVLKKYLSSRKGYLATTPHIPLTLFEEIRLPNNSTRSLQYTFGPLGLVSSTAAAITQYLGNGMTHRGRLGISSNLKITILESAIATTGDDNAAIVEGLFNLYTTLGKIDGLQWIYPPPGSTRSDIEALVAAYPYPRGSNHWLGTCKLGLDDGRKGGGSVVDLNAKVYGTDNLFVVDASIFPSMVTANPMATIMVASEHAIAKILALSGGPSGKRFCISKGELCGDNRNLCCSGATCKQSTASTYRCT